MYRRTAQHFSLRTAIALTICIALLPLPGISPLLSGAVQGQSQGESRKEKPKPGKPEGMLPDLEEVKNELQFEREPAAPVPSTIRSPKSPLQPWNGKRVGDLGTHGTTLMARARSGRTNRAHARSRVNPPPPVLDDQFVQNFFTWAVVRAPYANEVTFWNDQFRVAYAQGQSSVMLAGVALGKTLFESAEYAARNRNDHWYVYDLYKTFLMRDPDASGWAYWESVVPTNGRENVRRAFEVSPEFSGIIAGIVPNGSATTNAASLISALVDPRNQPASGMLTRDASWSVPLLSLPGRAGLDLGLSLSYSSMVWTRSGPYMHFDEDNGFPSPGFRLGFPVVQRKVFDAQTARNAFLMITPAGRRVELRQVGSSNIYEAADSSYLQLTDNSPYLVVRSTDGTQLSFTEINNEFSCTQVKDRNGNYLSISHNYLGRIATITDTLGRVITFNYDGNMNLISITQAWNGQPSHQWVSFVWSTRTMSSFSDSTLRGVIGPANGASLPVITQVNLNDTSDVTFDYTNSLQVSVIRDYFGTLERNATTFTYETPAGDAPRLVDSRVSANNWTGINGVPAQVIAQYSVAGDGACVMTAPDGTVYKEYYGTGWQRGLTTLSEVWSGGVRQKWATTTWTQDNTTVSYEVNPRVTETNVYDAGGNRRRTTIDYGTTYVQYGLPYLVREFAADGATVIRETYTDYNLSQSYLERRIIGLVSEVQLTSAGSYQGKITYAYDDPARLQATAAGPTQHDPTYNTSFTVRGNVTAVSRWDVTDSNNAAKKLTTYTNYNNTGTPISGTDAAGHQSSVSYADSFSDSINRNTFAYPTTITDAGGNSSYVQYNFDFGATTRTQSPTPAGQSAGAIQTMAYNNLGQLEQTTTTNNGAYTRYIYGSYYVQSFGTVNNVADEAYAIQIFDGQGRVTAVASNHPNSTGGYKAQLSVYDMMGRAVKTSNPGEITGTWVSVGDDAAGWLYTQQSYDWQGRPLVTTNADGTTKEASYSGCGCAGGAVVTLTDAGTIDAGVAKRRQQRIYSDVLGRTVKTELLNWQNGSVYSATVNSYNARDQLEQIQHYAGPAGSGVSQVTTMTYDGYGRLKTKHVPEHATGTTVTWSYNADDTVQSTTDPRGSTATFTYNSRHQPTAITYTLSGSTTITTSYAYDGAGNRTSMTDSLGNVSYSYDQLSRMTSEVRYFTTPNRSYTINYGYNLSDQLSSVSYPDWSQQVGYHYDSAGRLNSVTGSGYVTGHWQGTWPNWTWVEQSVTSFASNIAYRAAGSVKQMTYGNGLQLSLSYNSRLQLTQFQLSNFASSANMVSNYDYYNDGKIKYVGRPNNNVFDRAFTYDHAGRMKEALTGAEARGGSTPDGPYRETYSYDAFGNTTSLTNRLWTESPATTGGTYVNNRNQFWAYDNNGFVVWDMNNGYQSDYEYDAAGRRKRFVPWFATVGFIHAPVEFAYEFDGDNRSSKQVHTVRGEDPEYGIYAVTTPTYYLHSTVLGQVVAELDAQGNKATSHIYVQGMRLATDHGGGYPYAVVQWQYTDPVTGNKGISNIARENLGTELSTLGADVTVPPPPPEAETYQAPIYIEPVKQTYYQIEGGPSDSYGIDSWYTNVVNKDFDRHMAETYWRHGFRDWAMAIVANNPNVGVQSEHYDRNGNHKHTSLRWGAQAAGFLMGLSRDLESGRLLDANSEAYGEVVGYELNSPEELVTDNPTVIDNSDSANQSCSIKVSFTGSYEGRPNGPSLAYSSAGQPFYGIGFSVSVSQLFGDVAIRSTVEDPKPKNTWLIEQWVTGFTFQNGQVVRQQTAASMDKLGRAVPRPKRDGNTVSWWDHPGTLATGVQGYYTKRNFFIKAYNGERYCELAFHLTFRIFRGQITNSGWGRGTYR